MAMVRSLSGKDKFLMDNILINVKPVWDKDGNTLGITGNIDAHGGYYNCSYMGITDKNRRDQYWDINDFSVELIKLGINPQTFIGAFAAIFEAREKALAGI